MRVRLAKAALAFFALCSSAAFAGRPPREWAPPPQLTPEQIEAQKIASKQKFNAYGKDVPVEAKPVPWMAIGMAGLAFVVAAPFAIKSYLNASKELSGNKAFTAGPADFDDIDRS